MHIRKIYQRRNRLPIRIIFSGLQESCRTRLDDVHSFPCSSPFYKRSRNNDSTIHSTIKSNRRFSVNVRIFLKCLQSQYIHVSRTVICNFTRFTTNLSNKKFTVDTFLFDFTSPTLVVVIIVFSYYTENNGMYYSVRKISIFL